MNSGDWELVFLILPVVVGLFIYFVGRYFTKKVQKKASRLYFWLPLFAVFFGFLCLPVIIFSPEPYLSQGNLTFECIGIDGIKNCEDTEECLVKVPTNHSGEISDIEFYVIIKVLDEYGKPVEGAKVTVGGNSSFTNESGIAKISVSCTLPANVENKYVPIKVEKKGYFNLIYENGVMIVRI